MLAAAPSSATVAALLVWYYVVNAMVAVLFWSLSSWVIDLRASKQIHGLVGAGTFVAGFLGGLSVRPLLSLIDVDDLLWLTVAALVVCLGLTLRICRVYAPAAAPDDLVRPPTPEELQSVRRFAGLNLAIVGLVAASFCFVDRLFLTQAEARFGSADELAAFLGEFSAAVELLSFAVQLGLTGRIFHRLGLGGTLMLMPAVLCGLSSLLLGFELFNGATGLYCGEQDLFAFMIDPNGWIEIGGEEFAPGFFVWNSEVGRRSLGIQAFWYQRICMNHIVWDATDVIEFTRKHTASVQEGLGEIRRIIAQLVERRDVRRDGFHRVVTRAMSETFRPRLEAFARSTSTCISGNPGRRLDCTSATPGMSLITSRTCSASPSRVCKSWPRTST